MLVNLAAVAAMIVLVQAADPVPPQRVDPQSVPMPEANDPVEPSSGAPEDDAQQDTRASRPERPERRAIITQPMRIQEAPSIFTDEAYRHARVRSLLYRALEGNG
ncbi:MAG: hypothetical protein ACIAQU_02145 [Phycisphaerales bacterium JB064]